MALTHSATDFLPSIHQERMDMQAELVNAPRVGVEENTSFFNAQLNLSPTLDADDGMHPRTLLFCCLF